MELRNRTRKVTELMGEVYTMSNGFHETLGTGYSDITEDWCADTWKKKAREDKTLPPTPTLIEKHMRNPLCMNRNTLTFRFTNYPVGDQGTCSKDDLNSVRTAKNSAARVNENLVYTQRLLAESNPFRYEYSVPVSMKELVDVSTLFKIAAKSFAAYIGGNYLNYKFGWVSFVRDIKTLHGITVVLERRIKEFQSLSKHGGLRRKIDLDGKQNIISAPNSLINSTWGATIRADITGKRQTYIYGTVRWRFKSGFDVSLDKLEAFNLAVSKIFDLGELDSQTVWNLIPFSWLVDYFVDLNSFFGAKLGEDVIEPYDICIIRRSRSKRSYKVVSKPSTINMTGLGICSRQEYDRDVVSKGSYPAVSYEFLSRNQLLVIAALIASFKR